MFANVSAIDNDYNFAIVGDWGCTSDTKKTVKSIQNTNPELIINLGDLSYKKGPDCWFKTADHIDENMKITLGNHDALNPKLLKQYMDHFGLTKQYYSFDYNNIHFVAMSTEVSYLPGSEQYKFVAKDLEQAAKNENIKWIIVFHHKPQYSSDCDNNDSCDPINKLREAYHRLFDRYGVDVVFSAHAHNYQRTYPLIFNENNSTSPVITANQTNIYNDIKGQIHLVVGTGGMDMVKFSSKNHIYLIKKIRVLVFLILM
ncbi:MAG: metallophosphoesterase [Nitrososphaeraceae archaeon]